MAQIKITIDSTGKSKVEAVGFSGDACTAATANIENALSEGTGKVERVFKEEWAEYGTTNEQVEVKW